MAPLLPIWAGSLTQSLGHTINGYGEITAALTNNGTVNANVNGQSINLTTGPMTNNSLIEATGTAALNIGSVTITQGSGGQINAAGGTVNLTGGATITGGTLGGSGGGIFQNTNGTNTIGGLTSNATLNILGNTVLSVSSPVVNNGAITINSNESYPGTLTADGTITGTGSITLQPTSYLLFGKNVGGSSQSSLTIKGSSSYMDLNNNHFYINYGANPDPVADVPDLIWRPAMPPERGTARASIVPPHMPIPPSRWDMRIGRSRQSCRARHRSDRSQIHALWRYQS